jgi:hypothetical protein
MDRVDRSGIGGDRIAEGVGILVGVVAGMITGMGVKVLGFGVRGEIGAVFGMEGFWGGGDWRFMFFFESVGIGGAIGFIGLDFLKKLLDVFGFVFEEMHGKI